MSKRVIEDFSGAEKEIECIGCFMNKKGEDSPGYVIATKFFHAHQDYEIPIPGFVILSTRRHIKSFDEFTDGEASEFVDLVRKIRKAQREALGIKHVYFVQEEDTKDHFHLWFLPRYAWMNDEAKFGRKVSSARPVLQFAQKHMKTPENIAKVKASAEKLRNHLNKFS